MSLPTALSSAFEKPVHCGGSWGETGLVGPKGAAVTPGRAPCCRTARLRRARPRLAGTKPACLATPHLAALQDGVAVGILGGGQTAGAVAHSCGRAAERGRRGSGRAWPHCIAGQETHGHCTKPWCQALPASPTPALTGHHLAGSPKRLDQALHGIPGAVKCDAVAWPTGGAASAAMGSSEDELFGLNAGQQHPPAMRHGASALSLICVCVPLHASSRA